MTSINDKLGLKRGGKRSMMKLPATRAEAIKITAAKCPACQRTGARPAPWRGLGWVFCSWCNHAWELPA
jgi:hypothetical protein